jgi:hypothetical protein
MEEKMTYQEKRTLVSLISLIVVFIIYYLYIYGIYQEKSQLDFNEMKFWASVILILIPVLMVSKIVTYIIFTIINTIITRREEHDFMDELDKMVDLKATRNFGTVFTIGFLLAMGSLLLNMSVFVMFNIFLFTIIIAGIVSDISQFYYYRKGV